MVEIIPTIGRIVIYKLSEEDAATIQIRRVEGTQASMALANHAHAGQEFPAMVVRTWGDQPDSRVNLKVFLDGADNFWATSRVVGDRPGEYHWMDYQKGQAAKYEELERQKQSENLDKKAAFEAQESKPVDAKPQWPNKKST